MLGVVQLLCATRADAYSLFSGGSTKYSILLPAGASEDETKAASELKTYLEMISGADFPIVHTAPKGYRIIIGRCAEAISLADLPRYQKDDESFMYQNYGSDIVICGGSDRGTRYGVYAFLENELGCKWLTYKERYIPSRKSWGFSSLSRRESPAFKIRDVVYWGDYSEPWAIANRNSGYSKFRGCHTFGELVPPDEFFAAHPEYFSLIDGKRMGKGGQLCLSNPALVDICTRRLRKIMKDRPEFLVYDLSQNDNLNHCQCSACKAIDREEGSPSGAMLRFVNKVADNLKDEFPDKYIGTFAYTYTRKPPLKARPRPNVVVRLCSFETCLVHDFHSCPQNESFYADLKKWASIAPTLAVWDYYVSFSDYFIPFPNLGVLQSRIKDFRDNGVISVLAQGNYNSAGGDLCYLRAWLLSKLLWNPDADVKALTDEFLNAYYGRSARYIAEYLELMQSSLTPETHMKVGTTYKSPYFSDSFIARGFELMARAKAAASGDERLLRRIEAVEMPLEYIKYMKRPFYSPSRALKKDFLEAANAEGVSRVSELRFLDSFK